MEVLVHHPSEERQHVHQSEVHDLWDESPILSFICGLVLIFLRDPDVVVSPPDIEL